MSDGKETFEILLDSSGDGAAPSKSESGDAAAGKVGLVGFSFKDASGNLVLPALDASGGIPASIVESTRAKVLNASDLIASYTWADFGTNKERVTRIDYTSATVLPAQTVRQTFSYTLLSGNYRLDTQTWTIV